MHRIHIGTTTGDHYYLEALGIQAVWQSIQDGQTLELLRDSSSPDRPPLRAVLNPAHVVIVNAI